jgi:hypothetical protein
MRRKILSAAALTVLVAGLQACRSDGAVAPAAEQNAAGPGANDGSNGDGGSSSSDENCAGTLSDGTYENVIVDDGDVCVLDGAYVDGNVLVHPGGSLQVKDSEIKGNIQTDGAMYVWVADTYVGGNIQIDRTRDVFADIPNHVCASRIEGDLQLQENRAPFAIGPCSAGEDGNRVYGNLQVEESDINGFAFPYSLDIAGNYVRGDLQFFENRSDSGHRISGNEVSQNLQCKENYPAPEVAENSVGGDAEDQCEPPMSS